MTDLTKDLEALVRLRSQTRPAFAVYDPFYVNAYVVISIGRGEMRLYNHQTKEEIDGRGWSIESTDSGASLVFTNSEGVNLYFPFKQVIGLQEYLLRV